MKTKKSLFSLRRKLLINKPAQLKTLGLMAFTAAASSCFTGGLISILYRNGVTTVHDLSFSSVGILALGGLLTFSIIVIATLLVTNRLCGPIFRLHREIRSLADGGTANTINIRKDDDFQEVIYDFNRLLEQLKKAS